MPRLVYSVQLLDEILKILTKINKKNKKSNKTHLLLQNQDDAIPSPDFKKRLEREWNIALAIELLAQIQAKLNPMPAIGGLPLVLPSTIFSIRAISANLYDILPDQSKRLCELSANLGSITIDSAALSDARFDFRKSNFESHLLLDEAKLIVDSKLSKQYPNLDLMKSLHA